MSGHCSPADARRVKPRRSATGRLAVPGMAAAESYGPEVVVRADDVAPRAPDDPPADQRVQQVQRLQQLGDDRQHGRVTAPARQPALHGDQRDRSQRRARQGRRAPGAPGQPMRQLARYERGWRGDQHRPEQQRRQAVQQGDRQRPARRLLAEEQQREQKPAVHQGAIVPEIADARRDELRIRRLTDRAARANHAARDREVVGQMPAQRREAADGVEAGGRHRVGHPVDRRRRRERQQRQIGQRRVVVDELRQQPRRQVSPAIQIAGESRRERMRVERREQRRQALARQPRVIVDHHERAMTLLPIAPVPV